MSEKLPKPPKGWNPPRFPGRPRGRVPDYVKGFGLLAWGKIASHERFPDPEKGYVTYARLRQFAAALEHEVIDERPASGDPAKENETEPGSGKFKIYVDPALTEFQRSEALLHGLTEIKVREIMPNMAAELFPEEWRTGIGFRYRPPADDVAHRAACWMEDVWRGVLHWNQLPPEEAWKRRKDALGMDFQRWLIDYYNDPKRNKGETRGVRLKGIDGLDPDVKDLMDD